MMTAEQIEALGEQARAITDPITEFLLEDIARRVSEAGQLTSTASYQVWRLQNLGVSQKELKKELARRLKVSRKRVEELMTQAAEVGYRFDLSRLPHKNAVPFAENEKIQRIVSAGVEMAGENLTNMVSTLGFVTPEGTAEDLTTAYQKTCDFAFQKTVTGAQDYNSAIRQATKHLADRGIVTIDYESGRSISLEAAVRRNVMGGLGLMQERISQQNHDDLGCDGWEISAHGASAPDHEPIQGKQYSDAAFTRLNNSLLRRIGTLNCGHAAFPIILGVNDPQYSASELEQFRQENEKGIDYEGQHFTMYEATQRQRELERAVRKRKRKILIGKAAGLEEQVAVDQTRLMVLNGEYARFSKAAGLKSQRERMHVPGFGVKEAGVKRRKLPRKVLNTDHLEFVAAKSGTDAQEYAQDVLGLTKTEAYGESINISVANGLNEAIFKISTEFGSLSEYGYLKGIQISKLENGAYAAYSPSKRVVVLNKIVTLDDAKKRLAEDAEFQYARGGWSSASPLHSVYHELGHAVQHMYLDDNPLLQEKIKHLYHETYCDILGADTQWVTDQSVIAKYGVMAKEAGFSYYGLRNTSDFVAEAIAQYYCSDAPGTIALKVINILLKG